MSDTDYVVFVGNLSDDVDCPMIRELFVGKGTTVSKIDIKVGFAFVYIDSEATTSDALEEVIKDWFFFRYVCQ